VTITDSAGSKENTASPEPFNGSEPSRFESSSRNSTVPVGVPAAPAIFATVTVRSTSSPEPEGFTDESIEIDVGVGSTI